MGQRGRILRDASSGTGLISSNGSQHEFTLEGVWRSDTSPKQDMVVEFELDGAGKVVSISAVSESDLAKEQAEKAAKLVKEKGLAAFNDIAARVGKPVLIAMGVVIVCWFYLSAIDIKGLASMKITFWQMLGVINASGGMDTLQSAAMQDKGIYGLLGILALAGPFIAQFWKNPLAHLGNALPLALMLLVGGVFYMELHNSVNEAIEAAGQAGGIFGGGQTSEVLKEMARKALEEALKALHIGVGAYIALAASAYLAFIGATKYLAAKA
jgi:hypothetical protein